MRRSPSSRRRLALLALGCTLLWPALAPGEEAPAARDGVPRLLEQTEISGSLRGSYWSASRRLDDRHDLGVASAWLRAHVPFAPSFALVADGWLMNDDLFEARATRARLREGYVDVSLGPVDVRLGQQIIAWGRADRINPTDNLTPRDFTLLVPEDSDQRMGTTGASVTYHVGGVAVTGVWLPTFEPHVIPIQTPPAPFVARPRRLPSEPVSQFAVRVDQTGGPVDWSVSYFDGFNLYPGLEIVSRSLTAVLVAPTYHRIRVVGADAAAVWGPYGLRAEAAYTFTEHAEDPTVIRPFFFMVVGADRTLPGHVYVNAQFVLRVVSDFQSPGRIVDPVARAVVVAQATINDQLDEVSQAATLRVSRKWLDDTLETEIGAIVGLVRLDYALRPKVRYAVTDRVRLTVGGDIFRGPTPSVLGRLRDNSTAYVELRWDF